MSQHSTVGRYFKSMGAVFFCARYVKSQGFWMRMVSGERTITGRSVGDEACVSERAIGRTFHAIYASPYEKHESPCECYVCEAERTGEKIAC
jgi:hypothetical protein